jgi:hypothetical protein
VHRRPEPTPLVVADTTIEAPGVLVDTGRPA